MERLSPSRPLSSLPSPLAIPSETELAICRECNASMQVEKTLCQNHATPDSLPSDMKRSFGPLNFICSFQLPNQLCWSSMFCLCDSSPILLCGDHALEHLKQFSPVGHRLHPMSAYPMMIADSDKFRKNQISLKTNCDLIDEEIARVDHEKTEFDGFLTAIEAKLATLRGYSAQLQAKSAALSQLQERVKANSYNISAVSTINAFLQESGVQVTHPAEVRCNLGQLTGTFQRFDLLSALDSLSLRPISGPEASPAVPAAIPTGEMLLTLLQEQLSTPSNQWINRDSNACFLTDSKLFVTGPTNRTWLISSAEGTVALAPMRESRKYHGVVALKEHVYVFGGISMKDTHLKTWEAFAVDTGQWGRKGKMAHRRFLNPAVVRGKIYLAGGFVDSNDSIEEFTPETGAFTPILCKFPLRQGGVAMEVEGTLVVLSREGITQTDSDIRNPRLIEPAKDLTKLQMYSLVSPIFADGKYYILVTRGKELIKLELSGSPNFVLKILA